MEVLSGCAEVTKLIPAMASDPASRGGDVMGALGWQGLWQSDRDEDLAPEHRGFFASFMPATSLIIRVEGQGRIEWVVVTLLAGPICCCTDQLHLKIPQRRSKVKDVEGQIDSIGCMDGTR
jgi:hypothetical protein